MWGVSRLKASFGPRGKGGCPRADKFGLRIPAGVKYDFAVAMARMRKLRARISHTDSAHRDKKLGVDVFIGEGRFTGPYTVEVRGETLRPRKPSSVPVPCGCAIDSSIQEAGYLTNERIFTLTELPPRLAVIGADPSEEMAQAFARFGSRVGLFEQMSHILLREDADAAAIVQDQMRKDGVSFVFESKVTRVERYGGEKVVHYVMNGAMKEVVVDGILVVSGVRRI